MLPVGKTQRCAPESERLLIELAFSVSGPECAIAPDRYSNWIRLRGVAWNHRIRAPWLRSETNRQFRRRTSA